MTLLLTIALLLAHDWYPKACCGDHDCHPIPCEQIHYDGKYWVYKDFIWAKDKVRASLDEHCHVCITKQSTPICIFLMEDIS